MSHYVIGLDFGTNSCRALVVDTKDGKELGSHVFPYPTGKDGVVIDESDPNLARQNPADYILGIEVTITQALNRAAQSDPDFRPEDVIGIGVDTTGSSPMPLDGEGAPLCFNEEFRNNKAALVWLWKDHTSYAEAEKITALAAKMRPEFLGKIGGVYSSEWWWSKILHCKTTAPEVYEAAQSWVEICDWIPAHLTGITDPVSIMRSVCAAGHKALFNSEWGGLPDEEFLRTLSPGLEKLRPRLYDTACTSEKKIGNLSSEWARKLGLSTEVSIAVGAFDAHMGAVGAGIAPGTLVKIMGTSTCDIMVAPAGDRLADIPGVCGIVNGSVLDGYYGIEAGQSAVGDIFLWFLDNLVPERYGINNDEKFDNLNQAASKLLPGESGLIALDWNNGNRTVLVDVRLSGLLIGQTLHTQPHEIYRALIEATAFGALEIIDRIEEYGVKIKEVVNCGGLAAKNPLLMQIYADVTGRRMKISRSDQTPALGAAIFSAVAAGEERGGYDSVYDAEHAMTGTGNSFEPDEARHEVYSRLYTVYRQLHDAFGTKEWTGNMYNVMKDLLNIRDEVRRSKVA